MRPDPVPAAALFALVAALLGAVGVGLGAFGAHGLKERLGAAGLETWHTAVTYHLTHTLALLAVAVWLRSATPPSTLPLGIAGWCFAAGVLAFSGSLYVLALGGPRLFGPVTPLGGLFFLIGWVALAWAAVAGSQTS